MRGKAESGRRACPDGTVLHDVRILRKIFPPSSAIVVHIAICRRDTVRQGKGKYSVMSRKKILIRLVQVAAGLLVFSFGIHLTIYANLGLAPWDCLSMGVARRTPLNFGMAVTVISVLVLGIDLFLKERIGLGTVIDSLITGSMIQFFQDVNPLPENTSVPVGIVCILAGFVFVSLGMRIYMGAEQCCGPRDALMVGVGKWLPFLPIGYVEVLLWSVVLLAGWLLGGPVGIGTVLSTFGAGVIMQAIYSALKFEPRDLKHMDIMEAIKILLNGE